MKSLNKVLTVCCLLGVVLLEGCSKDEPGINLIDQQKELIAGASWNVSSVTVTGTDVSSAFSGTTITFQSTGNYTTTIDQTFSPIWPSSGTWTITELDVLMVNNIEMAISNATSSTLSLSFSYTTAGIRKEGKISSLDGSYVMILSR